MNVRYNANVGTVVCFWRDSPHWARALFTGFRDHTQRRITVGRTPLDEWSAGRRDLYLTTHDTHNRQTSMPPVGFEPTISAGERPQTYALDRAATGTGLNSCRLLLKCYATRAETRFRLTAKRTSPFKSAEASVQSTNGTAEVCATAVVMLDTPCSEVV